MKLKIIFASIFFALIFQISHAQHSFTDPKNGITYVTVSPKKLDFFPDSIRVELPDQKAIVIFQFRNISHEASFIGEFPNHLKEWVAQLAESSPVPTIPHKVSITFKENNDSEIRIWESSEPTTLVRTHERMVTELLPPGWELTIIFKNVHVYVYAQTFKDLETLAQQRLLPIQEKLKAYTDAKPLHRKSLISRFVLQSDKITFHENTRKTVMDFLELNLSGGLGFFGQKIYPELNPYASLLFGDRFQRKNYKISFIYNNLFFTERNPDGGFTTRPNSFVSVSWSKNLVFKGGDPSWIGFGVGLLVRRSGDYFKGQTAKFFISKDVGHFNLAPELYLTDEFRKAQLGFRLNYTF